MQKEYIVPEYLTKSLPKRTQEFLTEVDPLDSNHLTMVEKCAALNIKTFDTALPRGWVDDFTQIIGQSPVGYFVWSYDDGKVNGEPMPISRIGVALLKTFNHIN